MLNFREDLFVSFAEETKTMKKTVVIGASPNPARYAHMAVISLLGKGHEVKAVGLREGSIDGVRIHVDRPHFEDVDTVSLYVGPQHQDYWKEYIESLHPKRVIFNPGSENPEYEQALEAKGIEADRACTLVLLSAGAY
jgi:predicted CoA-binding protein